MDELDRWLRITDQDIHVARRLWEEALDDEDATDARLTLLYDDLRRLINTQAQQIAEEFRAAHRAARDGQD